MWVRIDNRLVHGQVVEAWLPYIQAKEIWVLNEQLYRDELRQEIMQLAIPGGIAIQYQSPADGAVKLQQSYSDLSSADILVLLSNCSDARKAFESGMSFSSLNIANMHYSPGKKQVCDHVALGDDDIACLHFFSKKGVALDFRCIPNKPVQVSPLW